MNRLLGQKIDTTVHSRSPRSPSEDSTRSPMSADSASHQNHLLALSKQASSNSPLIASQQQQSLSPSVSRKPVDSTLNGTHAASGSTNNMASNMYKFDDVSPINSSRNSTTHHGMTDLEMDPQVKLEDYDWADLEDQFAKRMEAFRAEEDGIWDEWKGWGELFKAWASTISVHDEERAAKRLRTRMAFTQGSEESLEAKRQHYIKVVQAFESALQLLGSRNSAHNFI